MALPTVFLPFDPSSDDEKDENDQVSSESDYESGEESLDNPTSNGTTNHEEKQNGHIGGGVILVSRSFVFSSF